MINEQMKINAERRKRERLLPKNLTFVALRPDFVRLGKILDINREGLRFRYIVSMDEKDSAGDAASLDVDIFLGKNGYYLAGIPCTLVYDNRIEKGSLDPIKLEYRLCGLQFGELSKGQSDLLDFFLSNHTVESI